MLRSSALLIDLYMLREAPLSDDLERLPRLAASAAPFAVFSILRAYTKNSYLNYELDSPATP